MKEFIKITLASMTGFFLSIILTSILSVFLFIVLLAAIGAMGDPSVSISKNTVLELKFDYEVPERSYEPLFEGDAFSWSKKIIGLNEIIKNIRKAKSDDNIAGIYLNLNNLQIGGFAQVDAIRDALIDFKTSGKFIIAHGDAVSQKAFYLSSVADKIFLAPVGALDFRGLAIQYLYIKKLLEKLNIEPQIFYYGKYKSAIEIFNNEKMSDENRLQTSELLNSMYKHFLSRLENARGIKSAELHRIADNYLIQTPQDAYNYKFIDSVIYIDQVYDIMKSELKIKRTENIKFIPLSRYRNVKSETEKSENDRIAVIYATGEIARVKGNENTIGEDNIINAIRAAKNNKKVKAIVMRVNSPGGDALLSDLIWREVVLAKEKKPFIVSMGAVAASGGYYISCAADTIVAEPTTITGSIGVFGVVPNMQKFFSNKLGITFDEIGTGKYSNFDGVTKPFNQSEKIIFQKSVDRVYETFVQKVANGRKKSFNEIHKIGQGRIWTGIQAKEIGLIDVIGDLNDALQIASKMAKITKFNIIELPRQKDPVQKFIDAFNAEVRSVLTEFGLKEEIAVALKLKEILKYEGVQTRMPVNLIIE